MHSCIDNVHGIRTNANIDLAHRQLGDIGLQLIALCWVSSCHIALHYITLHDTAFTRTGGRAGRCADWQASS